MRDDTRDAEVAVQLPTATWHAYNSFGGESCYVSQHGKAFVLAAGSIFYGTHLRTNPTIAQMTANLLVRAEAKRYHP